MLYAFSCWFLQVNLGHLLTGTMAFCASDDPDVDFNGDEDEHYIEEDSGDVQLMGHDADDDVEIDIDESLQTGGNESLVITDEYRTEEAEEYDEHLSADQLKTQVFRRNARMAHPWVPISFPLTDSSHHFLSKTQMPFFV